MRTSKMRLKVIFWISGVLVFALPSEPDDFPSPFMKRIKITHKTAYHYHTPVTFGPHRALLRPREGHDVHIASSLLEIEPKADVRWLRDIYGNSIAIFTFTEPGRKLTSPE